MGDDAFFGAEAQPAGEPVEGLDPVGDRGDRLSQRPFGEIPQQYLGAYDAAEFAKRPLPELPYLYSLSFAGLTRDGAGHPIAALHTAAGIRFVDLNTGLRLDLPALPPGYQVLAVTAGEIVLRRSRHIAVLDLPDLSRVTRSQV